MTHLLVDEDLDNYIRESIASGKEPDIKVLQQFAKALNVEEEASKAEKITQVTTGAEKKNGRGRPKKEPMPQPKYKLTMAHVDLENINSWKSKLNPRISQEFPAFTNAEVTAIADGLAEAVAGHYKYGKELRKNQLSKTNKSHIEIPVLMSDCAKVLKNVTGKPLRTWQAASTKPGINKKLESAAFKLTRIVAEMVDGRKLNTDLRRQGRIAKKI